MEKQLKKYNIIGATVLFIGFPILFWGLGNIPRRNFLKESISVLTLLAYFLMLGQFYLARPNKKILLVHKMTSILKIHKIIGYVFVPLLLLHPLLIVFPRYFESGVKPVEAFITIISTYQTRGVLLGIISWTLMLVLGLTSLFRNKLGMKYKTWRVFHGLLSIVFITLATWHAIELGRHTNLNMAIFMSIIAGLGIVLLIKSYLIKPLNRKDIND